MTEVDIRYTSTEKKDIRGQKIDPRRLAVLYGGREIFDFWKFVANLRKNGRSEFAVSRAKTKFDLDPELRFFKAGEQTTGEHPDVIFLGQNVAKGSIEIWNKFAAETYGFSVLELGDKKDSRKRRRR